MNDLSHTLAKGARQVSRKRVLLGGQLITRDGTHSVQVRDLSAEGVRISRSGSLAVDSDVVFVRGTIFAAAEVVWCEGATAGLRFYRALTDAEMGT